MFIDKLLLITSSQQDREVIKPRNNTLKFDPIYQKNSNGQLFFSELIEEDVL